MCCRVIIGYVLKVNNYYFAIKIFNEIDEITFYQENLSDFIINIKINILYHKKIDT